MLAAGGVVALTTPPPTAAVVMFVCTVGPVGTLAVGSWQSARHALKHKTVDADCAGNCDACVFSCH